jgi:hypothetical protein
MQRDPTNVVQSPILSDPRRSRRQILKAGVAGAAILALPEPEAEANPLLWIAGVVLGWGITKMLDHLWNGIHDRRISRYIDTQPRNLTTPAGFGTTGVDGRINGDNVEARQVGSDEYLLIPAGFLFAMDLLQLDEASPAKVFHYWGAPTSELDVRPVSGGFLCGQWWSQKGTRQRYLVMRTYRSGGVRTAGFIPCLGDYADAARAAVTEGHMARVGPRVRTLIEDPTRHVYLASDDQPGRV